MSSLRQGLRAAASIAGVSFIFTVLTSINAANAAILNVGATQQYKTIQGAVNAAVSGDTINIRPGTYACATIPKSNLTIQGTAAGVKVQGTSCGGKGLFVVQGTNTTIANITFTGAKVSAGNGAGIRMEGTNLTVLNSIFKSNQNGIMSGYNVHSSITVKGSTFDANGTCVSSAGCAHAIYAGHIGTLDVENSTFTNTKAGHHIKSRANNTLVIDNTIKDTTTGTSSYLVDVPNGGAVTITGNYFQKGANSTNPTAAIAMGEEGNTNPAGAMLIANNTFQNDRLKTQSFIWNKTGNVALVVSGNVLLGYVTKTLVGAGTLQNASSQGFTYVAASAGNLKAAMANFAGTPVNGSAATAVPEAPTLALFGSFLIGMGLFFGTKRKTAAK